MDCNFVQDEDEYDDTPENGFFKAILDNDICKVKAMIADGFSFQTLGFDDDDMALHFAVLNSKLDILNLFKNQMKDGDINISHIYCDDTLGTALHVAMGGHVSVEVVDLLLSWGADVNALDSQGCPVLHVLYSYAWEEFFEGQTNESSSTLSSSSSGTATATATAAVTAEGVPVLLGAQHSVQVKSHGLYSYFRKLELLHKYGADMNVFNTLTGLSAFHYWCRFYFWCTESCIDMPENHTWCKEFFNKVIEYGSDPNVTGERGTTALSYLAQRRYKPHHLAYLTTYKEMVSELLTKVKNKNTTDIHGRTLLHVACEFSNIGLIDELLKYDCDVNTKDKFGFTSLHLITHNITTDEQPFVRSIIDILVNKGALLDVQDSHGATPVHHCVHLNNSFVLQTLLRYGASPLVKDARGLDARELAKIEGDETVSETLGLTSTVYIRSRDVSPVVSDFRFGRFYHLCCHKQYTADCDVDERETVGMDNVDAWLLSHPMCKHNSTFIVQNAVMFTGPNKTQEFRSREDAIQIQTELLEVMQRAASHIGKRIPFLQSTVIYGGSVSEGTKIGSPDEFDVVFDLCELRKYIVAEEDTTMTGFVRIKIKQGEPSSSDREPSSTDRETSSTDRKTSSSGRQPSSSDHQPSSTDRQLEALVGKDGYISRELLSKAFHSELETCMRMKEIWHGTCFLASWGTVNADGVGCNIGQMNVIWYGPFRKRQDISIDVVPAIRMAGWEVGCIREEINILDTTLIQSIGPYLVMKDVDHDIAYHVTSADEDLSSSNVGDSSLFMISHSRVEHSVMRALPPEIKNGYRIAKCIQLQCPKLGFLCLSERVHDHISSYLLKTALFLVLDEHKVNVSAEVDDCTVSQCNDSVNGVDSYCSGLADEDVRSAIDWTRNIYQKIMDILDDDGSFGEYFVPEKKILNKHLSLPGTNIGNTFCRIILQFLKDFPTTTDIAV